MLTGHSCARSCHRSKQTHAISKQQLARFSPLLYCRSLHMHLAWPDKQQTTVPKLLQVKLCRRILRALASNSQPQQQEREAVTLLKASLDPPTLLSGGSLQDFEACLDTILFHSHRLLPATVTSLLSCFDLGQYASRLLEDQSGGATEEDQGSSAPWHSQDTAKACCTLYSALFSASAAIHLVHLACQACVASAHRNSMHITVDFILVQM